jgi:hypothetical protein
VLLRLLLLLLLPQVHGNIDNMLWDCTWHS